MRPGAAVATAPIPELLAVAALAALLAALLADSVALLMAELIELSALLMAELPLEARLLASLVLLAPEAISLRTEEVMEL
jgi:hypothetical protein